MTATVPRRHYSYEEYLALDEASNIKLECRLDVDVLYERAGA